jgi:integrase/recombinase XerD
MQKLFLETILKTFEMDTIPHQVAFMMYLSEHINDSTADSYRRDLTKYCNYMGEDKLYKATHQDIMNYIAYLRELNYVSSTIGKQVCALKHLYSFLIGMGYRTSHPCKNIFLKDRKEVDIQLQDLFTAEELERFMGRKERFIKLATFRNRTMISLLIYQGLRKSELIAVKKQDIDLEKGTITIQSTSKRQARTLPLKSQQVMLFYKYIYEIRPKLLAKNKQTSDYFLINLRGFPETGLGLKYLVKTFQHYFPKRKLNSIIIRQSVITNLLKEGRDIRVVQEFAGYSSLTATERYRENNLNELKNIIQKHHPLQ